MGASLSRRGLVLGLIAVTLAALLLLTLGERALERQARADLRERLHADAARIARQVHARWPELRWGNAPCLLDEPTLMAVWRRDGVELCRSAHGTPRYESVLEALLPRALAEDDAEQLVEGAEPSAAAGVLALAVPVRWEGGAVAIVATVAPVRPPEIASAALSGGLLGTWLVACGAVLLVERRRRRRLQRVFGTAAGALEALAQDTAARGAPPEAAATAPAPTLTPAPAEEAWSEHLQALAGATAVRFTALRQRLEQREAVLASMVEAVLAVDPGGRLIDLNPAAAAMFGLEPKAARGRDLLELLRHAELQRFVREALTSPEPVERELTLYEPEPRTVQVRGAGLRDARGRGLGTLLVLHDVTRLRRLERLRQDFVANVSHELKTPITAIKGFVETLLDGSVEDADDVKRFLGIVGRHAERLHAITEDLLSLSRIEQEAERETLHTEDVTPATLLDAAAAVCAEAARARRIDLHTRCDPGLRAQVNPQLVEQALVNLLQNAVKFAPEGSTVHLTGEARDGRLVLTVRDEGPGISAEHLPRLFERFYRVDKARTRGAGIAGGTGLGLAIVKHIAQAHGGQVEVTSRLGEGSTFTVLLPLRPLAESTEADG